jgi:hypothetical protein
MQTFQLFTIIIKTERIYITNQKCQADWLGVKRPSSLIKRGGSASAKSEVKELMKVENVL